jgi:hypothetical protein
MVFGGFDGFEPKSSRKKAHDFSIVAAADHAITKPTFFVKKEHGGNQILVPEIKNSLLIAERYVAAITQDFKPVGKE